MQGDVTSKKDLQRIVDAIKKSDGFINVLMANSGITGPTLGEMPKNPTISQYREHLFNNTSTEAFTHTYAVNLTGVFFSCVAFLELLDAGNKKGNVSQSSQVIATTSIGSFNRLPLAGFAYSSSKAGATHMMKMLATALVDFGIRSNVIAPGGTPSSPFSLHFSHFILFFLR